jgi:hypothetical protein
VFRSKWSYLVNAVVVEAVAVGDVLSADGMVHVGLDTARRDSVHGDLLVTEVCNPNLAWRANRGREETAAYQ